VRILSFKSVEISNGLFNGIRIAAKFLFHERSVVCFVFFKARILKSGTGILWLPIEAAFQTVGL